MGRDQKGKLLLKIFEKRQKIAVIFLLAHEVKNPH